MTKDEVLELAKECGAQQVYPGTDVGYSMSLPQLLAFANAIEQKAMETQREKDAQICEERVAYQMSIPCPDGISGCMVLHYVPASRDKTGKECADAIREKKNEDRSPQP